MTENCVGPRFCNPIQDLIAFDDMEAHAVFGREDRQHDVISRDNGFQRFGFIFGDVDENANISCEFTQLVKIQHCGVLQRNDTEQILDTLGY